MAFIARVNVLVLVNENSDADVFGAINDILREVQMDGLNGENRDQIVDWTFGPGLIKKVDELLAESITRNTYREGDAFREGVVDESNNKCMEMLSIATSAIRDHYAGFPDDEIVAPSGSMGMKALLRDLVGYLRESGVDDDGGWDCDATEDIKVKKGAQ